MFLHQNHGTGGRNGSIMVGIFVCLCPASQNPSEWEFFVPTRMDLGVKLLKASWHEFLDLTIYFKHITDHLQ